MIDTKLRRLRRRPAGWQEFTGKERDAETGLDYFGARYFSSAQGRFTSVDPIGILKQKMIDPQQWNMYSYVRNNPLRLFDPTGMYVTSCKEKDVSKCDSNTQTFEAARQRDLKSKDKSVRKAAAAYGDYGKAGVNVVFKEQQGGGGGAVLFDRDASGRATGTLTVNITPGELSEASKGELGQAATDAIVAHEGTHVEDDLKLIQSGYAAKFDITHLATEEHAYTVENRVIENEVNRSNPDWQSKKAIDNYIKEHPGLYNGSCQHKCFFVVFMIATLANIPGVSAQRGGQVGSSTPSCSSLCPREDVGLCHFALGMFFLRGNTNGLPDCLRQNTPSAQSDGTVSAILKGIAELDAASRDPSGIEISSTDLQILRAGSFLALGHGQILAGNYTEAEQAFSSARKLYQGASGRQTLTGNQIVKLAAGFFRAGAPVDGIALLARLPDGDPQRHYMMAEALFVVGDRMGAAMEYSKWIAARCASKPVMLTFDEYGEQQWVYLPRRSSGQSDACQTLPQELRARLEALKLETPYLAGLPKTNDAPVAFPATADR